MPTPPHTARWRVALAPACPLLAAAILGAVATEGLLVLPRLGRGADLVDANLGTALARELSLPLLAAVLVAAFLHGACLWLQGASTSRKTVASLLVAVAGVERLWLAPALFATWSRVDRVTLRPAPRAAAAEALALQHAGLLAALATLAALAFVLAWRERIAPSSSGGRA